EQATRGLADGGALIVIGRDPRAVTDEADEIALDLAPGRPLHAATWAHLLARAGCTDVVTHAEDGARGFAVVARRS
ncbi:MAG TPA: hypothetical protein VGI86_19770, partial [Acidimicrobiia bacterium]